MSSISLVSLSSFNLLFFTQVLTALTSTVKCNEYVADKGKNISIPCDANGTIMWVKQNISGSTIIQTGKFLTLKNVSDSDRGIYICFAAITPSNVTEETPTIADDGNFINATNKEVSIEAKIDRTDDTTTLDNTTIATNKSKNSINTTTTTTDELASALTTSLPRTTSSTSSLIDFIPIVALNSSTIRIDDEFQAIQKFSLSVRTPPGPVSQLYFKASTILGFLIWRFNKTMSGGYPVRSFTAEYRNISYSTTPYNQTYEHEWERMDPINIAPNVRQMEVYHLEPNTTYEFRIWANNQLGSGDVVTTNVTTLPETKEEGYEDSWDGIELIPNIILNPVFCDTDGQDTAFMRTIIVAEDEESEMSYESSESDHEPRMEKFKRKVSIFFTGPTIKRM